MIIFYKKGKENMKNKIILRVNILLVSSFCMLLNSCTTAESSAWKNFKNQKQANQITDLPDYSYAGYKFGEESIPKVNWKTFDVTKYGAIPNDGKSDKAAIQKAVNAAVKNGSGIVFFPAGVFHIAEKPQSRTGIEITASNILIKGSGSTPGGTVIYMKYAHKPTDPNKKWTVPRAFVFKPANNNLEFLLRKRDKLTSLATITKNANREKFNITVSDSRKFKVGQTIIVSVQTKLLNREKLGGLSTRPIWSEINIKGVSIAEKHIIKAINGNKLTLVAPLRTNINKDFGWKIYDYPVLENWGVEDIHFVGNFREKFVHHKNARHDSGYGMVSMRQGKNCWIRRNRVTNATNAFSFEGCLASSMIMNSIDGYQGHNNFSTNWGYGNLIGLSQDLTDLGSWHGPGISHEMTGAVVWRHTSLAKNYGGSDYHALFPHTSLWDNSTGNLNNSGGNFINLPLHLSNLTYWNFTPTKTIKNIDFWGLPIEKNDRKKPYIGIYMAFPNIIGYNSESSTINPKHVAILESFGKKVQPESLYEAQLGFRLGKVPEWVNDAKDEWNTLQKVHKTEAKNAKDDDYLNKILRK